MLNPGRRGREGGEEEEEVGRTAGPVCCLAAAGGVWRPTFFLPSVRATTPPLPPHRYLVHIAPGVTGSNELYYFRSNFWRGSLMPRLHVASFVAQVYS